MAFTEVILTEKIPALGSEADIVRVRRGYARNFLLPRGKALEVSNGSLRRINHLKAKRAEREAREVTAAEELASKINKLSPVFTLEAGGSGKAFGSVT
jgi:large subunit ribosomal protein L9